MDDLHVPRHRDLLSEYVLSELREPFFGLGVGETSRVDVRLDFESAVELIPGNPVLVQIGDSLVVLLLLRSAFLVLFLHLSSSACDVLYLGHSVHFDLLADLLTMNDQTQDRRRLT